MNKLSMLLAACAGLSAVQGYAETNEYPISMLGRYAVYDLQLKGKGLDVLEGKGKYTESYPEKGSAAVMSESETYDAVGIARRSAKGIVVEDMYNGGYGTFILFEKGEYEEMGAYIDRDSFFVVNSVKETSSKLTVAGLRSIEFEIYGDEVEIYGMVIGNYVLKAAYDEGEDDTSYALSYVASGVAGADEYPSFWTNANFIIPDYDGYDVPAYASSVKVKYNSKLSAQLVDAYQGASNETAGVEAAEDVLNAYIEKKAKVDDADFYFDWMMPK